jgi:hypothetical protein
LSFSLSIQRSHSFDNGKHPTSAFQSNAPPIATDNFTSLFYTMAAYSTASSTSSFSFNESEREEKENVQKAIENPLLLRSPPARPNTNNHYGSNASDNANHGGALTVHSQNNGEMGLRQRKMPHGDSFGPPPRASLSMGTVVDFLPPTKQDVSAPEHV